MNIRELRERRHKARRQHAVPVDPVRQKQRQRQRNNFGAIATTGQARRTGPGSQLKALLERYGITSRQGCRCDRLAAEMDRRGVDWCELHMDEIAEHMLHEAKRRRWPLLGAARMFGLSGVADVVMRRAAMKLIRDAVALARDSVDTSQE